MIEKVNLADKYRKIDAAWVPRIVGDLNGQYVKIARFHGEYVWHQHAGEDEMFLVLDGGIRIHFRDGTLSLGKGEFCIVPRGVEHKPEASEPASVLLFEPASTRNTGDKDHEYTIEPGDLERI